MIQLRMMCTLRFACYLLVIDLCGPIHIFLALQLKNIQITQNNWNLLPFNRSYGHCNKASSFNLVFFIAYFSIITSYLKILNMHVRKFYNHAIVVQHRHYYLFLRGQGSITQLELHPLMESPSNSCHAATHLSRVTRAWSDSKLKFEEGQMPCMTVLILLKRVCDVSFQW